MSSHITGTAVNSLELSQTVRPAEGPTYLVGDVLTGILRLLQGEVLRTVQRLVPCTLREAQILPKVPRCLWGEFFAGRALHGEVPSLFGGPADAVHALLAPLFSRHPAGNIRRLGRLPAGHDALPASIDHNHLPNPLSDFSPLGLHPANPEGSARALLPRRLSILHLAGRTRMAAAFCLSHQVTLLLELRLPPAAPTPPAVR